MAQKNCRVQRLVAGQVRLSPGDLQGDAAGDAGIPMNIGTIGVDPAELERALAFASAAQRHGPHGAHGHIEEGLVTLGGDQS